MQGAMMQMSGYDALWVYAIDHAVHRSATLHDGL